MAASSWNIKSYADQIDVFVESIKPSNDLNRILRPFSKFSQWKASECRAWLLLVSLPAVASFLDPKYLEHWMLFVTAIFLLLQDEVPAFDIVRAQALLNPFVRDIGTLYRKQYYLYNVHQLLHLPLYVRRWGPLWATSAFCFEGFNGLVECSTEPKIPRRNLFPP